MIVSFHLLPESIKLPCEMPDCTHDATVGLHENVLCGQKCAVFYHCQPCAEKMIREQDKGCVR